MDEDENEHEDEPACEDEREDEWKEYKESMREWKDQYKEILENWKSRMDDWRNQVQMNASKRTGFHFSFPPVPPVPPIPHLHSISGGRANVVASRMGDEELRLIDMLIEAGVFTTRSEAVAYLVSEGIKARQNTFEKVSASLEEIRKTRREAENQIDKLREEIGLKESKKSNEAAEQVRFCPKCRRKLSNLPADIVVCPYCGEKLDK